MTRHAFWDALERGESWGSAGRKYQIRPLDYPGVDALVARCGR